MFCTNCGKQIIDTARFCNYCGVKVVNFDENQSAVSDKITENPALSAEDNVLNAENVENSGNLLKMTNSIPSFVPKMNESPKSGYSPDSISISAPDPMLDPVSDPADVQSVEAGAQQSEVRSETLGIPEMRDDTEAATNDFTMDAPAFNGSTVPPAMGDPALTGSTVPPAMDAPAFNGSTVTPADKANLPERKYTIGHLIMCLASTAVMAIAAGVFAGLYFSVV